MADTVRWSGKPEAGASRCVPYPIDVPARILLGLEREVVSRSEPPQQRSHATTVEPHRSPTHWCSCSR